MIILILLCLLIAVVGYSARQGLDLVRWLTQPLGPRGHGTPRWLTLSLIATLLGVLLHLQQL